MAKELEGGRSMDDAVRAAAEVQRAARDDLAREGLEAREKEQAKAREQRRDQDQKARASADKARKDQFQRQEKDRKDQERRRLNAAKAPPPAPAKPQPARAPQAAPAPVAVAASPRSEARPPGSVWDSRTQVAPDIRQAVTRAEGDAGRRAMDALERGHRAQASIEDIEAAKRDEPDPRMRNGMSASQDYLRAREDHTALESYATSGAYIPEHERKEIQDRLKGYQAEMERSAQIAARDGGSLAFLSREDRADLMSTARAAHARAGSERGPAGREAPEAPMQPGPRPASELDRKMEDRADAARDAAPSTARDARHGRSNGPDQGPALSASRSASEGRADPGSVLKGTYANDRDEIRAWAQDGIERTQAYIDAQTSRPRSNDRTRDQSQERGDGWRKDLDRGRDDQSRPAPERSRDRGDDFRGR